MPSEKSIAKALYLLNGHAIWNGGTVINTHRLDKAGALRQEHRCFNGLTVADVLVVDDESVFIQTEEAKIVIGMVAAWLELRHSMADRCNGIIECREIQGVIESTLFQLEKAFIEEAKPEVVRLQKALEGASIKEAIKEEAPEVSTLVEEN